MGLMYPEKVLFEGRAPDIQRIAAKVVELSGLAVRIRQKVERNSAELDELDGALAFECAPGDEVWLCAPREGREQLPYWVWDDEQGDQPDKSAVYLSRGESEPTLLTYTLLALESLGGEARHPQGEAARRLCVGPITELELERRKWQASAKYLAMLFMTLVTAPLQPLFCFRWPKYSRADLNRGVRQTHEQFGLEGEPELFGRIGYAWFRVVHVAVLPFLLIGSIFAAVVTAIGALLAFLYSSVTFAGKTARLVFHLLTRQESAQGQESAQDIAPEQAEEAHLTGAGKSARNILTSMKQTYGAPEKMIPASEAEFGHLDLRGYRRFRAEMESQGYKYIGDFEIVVRSAFSIATFARTMVRIMVSEDGSITTNYFQFRQRRWPLLKALASGLRGLNWVRATRQFARGMKTRHCVGFGSEFEDGSWLIASNAESAGKLTMPPAMEQHYFPYGTATAVLLDAHRKRMQEILLARPGLKPRVAATVADILQGHERLSAQKSAFRASVQWVTRDELRAMSGGNHAYADEVYAEVRKLIERDAAQAAASAPPDGGS